MNIKELQPGKIYALKIDDYASADDIQTACEGIKELDSITALYLGPGLTLEELVPGKTYMIACKDMRQGKAITYEWEKLQEKGFTGRLVLMPKAVIKNVTEVFSEMLHVLKELENLADGCN